MKNVLSLEATMIERPNSTNATSALLQLKMWFEKSLVTSSDLNIHRLRNEISLVFILVNFVVIFPMVLFLFFQIVWFPRSHEEAEINPRGNRFAPETLGVRGLIFHEFLSQLFNWCIPAFFVY